MAARHGHRPTGNRYDGVIKGLVGRLQHAIKPGARGHVPATPEGTRIYAVGDIHGRDDLLADLLERVEADGAKHPEKCKLLIFLGDYVDRGLKSRNVLDRLVAGAPAGFEMVCLKGNHEEAMLQFLEDAAFGREWKYYGGLETLHSYGVTEVTRSDDLRDFERARDHFASALPETHLEFLLRLQACASFGDYFFAHAGVRPGIPLSRQVEHDLLWIRDDFLHWTGSFDKFVVHGHTPSEEVVVRANRIGVDTGAYITGILTALVLDGTERSLIQTGVQAEQVSVRAG